MRALPLLTLLLAACSAGTPAAHTPPPRRPAASSKVTPYQGTPGTCALDGLSAPLYSARDARWGNPSAPVAVVIFSDFECPFCAHQRRDLDVIKARYGPDKVQIVWKHMPLDMHPNARPAAEVAQAVFEAAGADAFWRFHDKTFSNRKAISPENLIAWAQEVGVPPERLKPALESPTVVAKIKEDISLARAVGLRGTPLLIINGLPLEGARDAEALAVIIDEELATAPAGAPHHACDRMREAWAPE